MTPTEPSDDVREIKDILARQLRNISWSDDKESDWDRFAEDFLPGAPLYPAARPARSLTVGDFVDRMKTLSQSSLRSFEQTMLGAEVHVFGSVAVAMGVCRNLENGVDEVRGVEAYLLVKDGGAWRIAAQAWDTEQDGRKIPDDLLASTMSSRPR